MSKCNAVMVRDLILMWCNEYVCGLQVHYIMLNQRYGEEDDQVGLLRLLAKQYFSSAYPLHEVYGCIVASRYMGT